MNCPDCREEMKEILPPQVQLQPVQNTEDIYPKKIICVLYHIFTCDKCGIKASKVETKDYHASDYTPDHADGL